MPAYLSVIIVILAFVSLMLLEHIVPLRIRTRSWQHRLLINILLAIPMFLIAALLVRPVGWHTMQWSVHHSFGLMHWSHLPVFLQMGIGFLLLDLSFYYWHWLNHKVPLLWRFHNVHHIDPDLDVSTAIRFHVVEVGYSTLFRLVQLGLIGVSPLTFIIYETAFQLNTLFQHSNVRLPIGIERVLNKLLVTPRMHGIHHSQIKAEVNANFSVIFPWWDWIHRTLHLNIPQAEIKIGVPAYLEPKDNRIENLLIMPFQQQRRYWGKDIILKRSLKNYSKVSELAE